MQIVNQNYPQIIKGVIKFFDTKDLYKATLQADNGTTYILQPAQPKVFYEALGAKDGGRVQVNGKPQDGDGLLWTLMKPI